MTRFFREGRTETVRPCSIESAAWVKAMEDNKSTVIIISFKVFLQFGNFYPFLIHRQKNVLRFCRKHANVINVVTKMQCAEKALIAICFVYMLYQNI